MRGGQFKIQKAQGFATLLFTMVVLASITAFAFISAQAVVTNQRSVTSYHATQSAFNIAQAGLGYAVPYLTENYATIANGSTRQVNMPDGGYASLQFDFVGDKDTIRVTSTGYTADGAVSFSVQELVKYQNSEIVTPWSYGVQSRGNLMMRDNAQILDLSGGIYTAIVGGTRTLVDSSKTTLASGVSSIPAAIKSDLQENPAFSAKTNDELAIEFLGQPIADFQAITTAASLPVNAGTPEGSYIYDYNATTFAPYSSASSYTINQVNGEAQLKGTTTIGSPSSPKNLVVNLSGNYTLPGGTVKASEFQIRQNGKIYGDLVINGNATIVESGQVTGKIIVEGNLTLVDSSVINGTVIVKGDLLMLNSSQVNGAVFALGKIEVNQTAAINGGVVSGGNEIRLVSSGKITYNSDNAKVVISGSGPDAGYGRVAGSWMDG